VMTTTEFRFGEIQARAEMLTPTQIVQAERARAGPSIRERDMTRRIDNTLEDSFPASDPPSWTASVARPAPIRHVVASAWDAGPIRRALKRAAAFF
jgi:hypothetical protein